MDAKIARAIKSWAERKYLTATFSTTCGKSIAFNRSFVTQKGAKLYTDGVKEINKKDDFNNLSVSNRFIIQTSFISFLYFSKSALLSRVSFNAAFTFF